MDRSVDLSDELRERGGSPLSDFLFPAPAPRSVGGIVRWWESRRLHYNAIVGATGFLTLGIANLVAALPPYSHGIGLPWLGVVVYGVAANICYLLGPTAEIGVEKLSGGKILPTGPTLFRMGLTFSVGLTLLPILFILVEWIIRILAFVF